MSAAQYDNFEKIFAGKWEFSKQENMEEFLIAANAPVALMKGELEGKPYYHLQRKGNSICEQYGFGKGTDWGLSMDPTYPLEEINTFSMDDPKWETKFKCSMIGDVLEINMYPIFPTGQKDYVMSNKVVGNELIATYSVSGDPSITATRVYTRS